MARLAAGPPPHGIDRARARSRVPPRARHDLLPLHGHAVAGRAEPPLAARLAARGGRRRVQVVPHALLLVLLLLVLVLLLVLLLLLLGDGAVLVGNQDGLEVQHLLPKGCHLRVQRVVLAAEDLDFLLQVLQPLLLALAALEGGDAAPRSALGPYAVLEDGTREGKGEGREVPIPLQKVLPLLLVRHLLAAAPTTATVHVAKVLLALVVAVVVHVRAGLQRQGRAGVALGALAGGGLGRRRGLGLARARTALAGRGPLRLARAAAAAALARVRVRAGVGGRVRGGSAGEGAAGGGRAAGGGGARRVGVVRGRELVAAAGRLRLVAGLREQEQPVGRVAVVLAEAGGRGGRGGAADAGL